MNEFGPLNLKRIPAGMRYWFQSAEAGTLSVHRPAGHRQSDHVPRYWR